MTGLFGSEGPLGGSCEHGDQFTVEFHKSGDFNYLRDCYVDGSGE